MAQKNKGRDRARTFAGVFAERQEARCSGQLSCVPCEPSGGGLGCCMR